MNVVITAIAEVSNNMFLIPICSTKLAICVFAKILTKRLTESRTPILNEEKPNSSP